jgi:hypothetical protein
MMGKPKPINGLAPKEDERVGYNQAQCHDDTHDCSWHFQHECLSLSISSGTTPILSPKKA